MAPRIPYRASLDDLFAIGIAVNRIRHLAAASDTTETSRNPRHRPHTTRSRRHRFARMGAPARYARQRLDISASQTRRNTECYVNRWHWRLTPCPYCRFRVFWPTAIDDSSIRLDTHASTGIPVARSILTAVASPGDWRRSSSSETSREINVSSHPKNVAVSRCVKPRRFIQSFNCS